MSRALRRTLCAVSVLVCASCGESRIDATKFSRVNATAAALKSAATDEGGSGSPEFGDVLMRFREEISVLEARISGRGEASVLAAYERAAENYQYFLRFERLDRDAVAGMVLLTGPNRAIASRYKLTMENRGGGRWVDRVDAMKVFSDQAERELATASQLLGAK